MLSKTVRRTLTKITLGELMKRAEWEFFEWALSCAIEEIIEGEQRKAILHLAHMLYDLDKIEIQEDDEE